MAQRLTVGERLLAYWKGQPVSIRPPATEDVIRDFESRYGITLADDVRDYFEHADGFEQVFVSESKRDWDNEGFNFYPLSIVAPVDSIREAVFSFPDSNHYYVFADYLTWSWGYAIRLGTEQSTVIIIGGGDEPIFVAENFEQLVDLYIANDNLIYGG